MSSNSINGDRCISLHPSKAKNDNAEPNFVQADTKGFLYSVRQSVSASTGDMRCGLSATKDINSGCSASACQVMSARSVSGPGTQAESRQNMVSFVKAVHLKYQDNYGDDQEMDSIVILHVSGNIKATESGTIKLPKRVSMSGQEISVAGDQACIHKMCAKVTELDLMENNISSWEEVFTIIECIPHLMFLNLTSNRLDSDLPCLDFLRSRPLPHLTQLVLNNTGVTWYTLSQLLILFPSLEELHLGVNNFQHFGLHLPSSSPSSASQSLSFKRGSDSIPVQVVNEPSSPHEESASQTNALHEATRNTSFSGSSNCHSDSTDDTKQIHTPERLSSLVRNSIQRNVSEQAADSSAHLDNQTDPCSINSSAINCDVLGPNTLPLENTMQETILVTENCSLAVPTQTIINTESSSTINSRNMDVNVDETATSNHQEMPPTTTVTTNQPQSDRTSVTTTNMPDTHTLQTAAHCTYQNHALTDPYNTQTSTNNSIEHPTRYPTLKRLFFPANQMTHWCEINKMGQFFPSLEYLLLSETAITSLGDEEHLPNSFPKLRCLGLGKTQLSSWEEVEKLSLFPNLSDVRLSGVPFLESFPDAFRFMHTVALLPNISTLNGSKIGEVERMDSERAFLRQYLDEEVKPKRYNELEKKYGRLDPLVLVELRPRRTVKLMVRVEDAQGQVILQEEMNIEVDQTVRALRKLLSNMTDHPANQLKLFYMDQMCNQGLDRLIYLDRKLHSYNPTDGDEIIVAFKD